MTTNHLIVHSNNTTPNVTSAATTITATTVTPDVPTATTAATRPTTKPAHSTNSFHCFT